MTALPGGDVWDVGQPEDPEADWTNGAEIGRFDYAYVGKLVVLRWAIVAAYLGLGVSGLMSVHPLALAGSAGWIALTNVLATWSWSQRRPVPWYDASYLLFDYLSVMVGVLATANLSYPIWVAFVMLMVQASAERSPAFARAYNAACVIGYAGAAVVMWLAGWYDTGLGVAAVTITILTFTGANLLINSDGNRRLRRYIRKLSVTDALTGLSNRRQLSRVLSEPPQAERLAIIVMDVDRFKQYNDEFGHLAGDRLLVRLADILRQSFPDAVSLARYGGDEFVVVLPCASPEEAESRVQKLLDSRSQDRVPVSVGLAVWPLHQSTLDSAFAAADDCLRAAKRSHRGSYAASDLNGGIVLSRIP